MSFACPITEYFCDACPDVELGRISAVAFVRKGVPVSDPTDNAVWNNLRCNGYAVIIPQVRGTYNGGAQQEGPGYGRVPTRRQSTNHEVKYFHAYGCENIDFYNQLMYSNDYVLWYTNGNKLWTSTEAVNINPMAPITDSVADSIEFDVTVTWSYKFLPYCFDAPSIFDSCDEIARLEDCLPCDPIVIPCP
jgi:hypothetical protein